MDGLLVVAGLGEVRQTTPGGEAGLNKRPASGAGATCPATGGSPLPFFFPLFSNASSSIPPAETRSGRVRTPPVHGPVNADSDAAASQLALPAAAAD